MKTITEALAHEHTLLNRMFEELERLLPEVRTVDEVRLLTRLLTGMLAQHAELEEHLAYAALDHALAEKGQLDRLYRDHQEIDLRLRQAGSATKLPEAVRRLKAGIKASREHFQREEQTIFPVFEKQFSPAALEALGAVAGRMAAPPGSPGFATGAAEQSRIASTGTEVRG